MLNNQNVETIILRIYIQRNRQNKTNQKIILKCTNIKTTIFFFFFKILIMNKRLNEDFFP